LKQESESSAQRIETLEKDLTQLHQEKSQLLSSTNQLTSEINQLTTAQRLLQAEKENMNQRILILQKDNQKYLDETRQLSATKVTFEHKVMDLQHQLVRSPAFFAFFDLTLSLCLSVSLCLCLCLCLYLVLVTLGHGKSESVGDIRKTSSIDVNEISGQFEFG
jgi:hypothetical protein